MSTTPTLREAAKQALTALEDYGLGDDCQEALRAAMAQQDEPGAIPAGWTLVKIEDLEQLKSEVNTVAALTVKNERTAQAVRVKRLIADMLEPVAQPLKAFTPAQRRRLYDNSPEHHKDTTSRCGFERIVSLTERAHGMGQEGGAA